MNTTKEGLEYVFSHPEHIDEYLRLSGKVQQSLEGAMRTTHREVNIYSKSVMSDT